jgi:hypothetical protein
MQAIMMRKYAGSGDVTVGNYFLCYIERSATGCPQRAYMFLGSFGSKSFSKHMSYSKPLQSYGHVKIVT